MSRHGIKTFSKYHVLKLTKRNKCLYIRICHSSIMNGGYKYIHVRYLKIVYYLHGQNEVL